MCETEHTVLEFSPLWCHKWCHPTILWPTDMSSKLATTTSVRWENSRQQAFSRPNEHGNKMKASCCVSCCLWLEAEGQTVGWWGSSRIGCRWKRRSHRAFLTRHQARWHRQACARGRAHFASLARAPNTSEAVCESCQGLAASYSRCTCTRSSSGRTWADALLHKYIFTRVPPLPNSSLTWAVSMRHRRRWVPEPGRVGRWMGGGGGVREGEEGEAAQLLSPHRPSIQASGRGGGDEEAKHKDGNTKDVASTIWQRHCRRLWLQISWRKEPFNVSGTDTIVGAEGVTLSETRKEEKHTNCEKGGTRKKF